MESRVSGVPAAHELLGAVSGTGGQITSQSDPGPVLHREMLYLVVLPYSHDSAPTSEPLRLVTWGGEAQAICPPARATPLLGRPLLSAVEDTIRQFHQPHLKAGGSKSDRQPAADRKKIHPAQNI